MKYRYWIYHNFGGNMKLQRDKRKARAHFSDFIFCESRGRYYGKNKNKL